MSMQQLFLNTTNDKGEPSVTIEKTFQTPDGRIFMILRRLHPYVARKPLFFGEVLSECIVKRDENGCVVEEFQKVRVYQEVSDTDIVFLKKQFSTEISLPFFGMKDLKNILGNKQLRVWNPIKCREFFQDKVFKLVTTKIRAEGCRL